MAGNGCMPGWIRGDGTSCDPKDVSQQESFTGHSSIVLERSQYGGSDVGYSKRVILNQKKAETLTLTGMSKSENVENDAPINFLETMRFGRMYIIKMAVVKIIK